MNLTINNKAYDQSFIESFSKVAILNGNITKSAFGEWDAFGDISKEMGNLNYIAVREFMVTGKQLNLKFRDLQNVSVGFPTTSEAQFWQINRFERNKKDFKIHTKNGAASIAIAETYGYFFDEKSPHPYYESKAYLQQDYRFTKLDRYKTVENLVSSNVQVLPNFDFLNGFMRNLYISDFDDIPYNYSTESEQKAYKAFENATFNIFTMMTSYQSLPNINGIQNVKNLNNSSLTSDLNRKYNFYIYTNGTEKIDYKYDKYLKYNYETRQIEESATKNKKGLIVPYDFQGDFSNEYLYVFDNGNQGKKQDLIKVSIIDNQKFTNSVLDKENGLVKLRYESVESVNKSLPYKYVFTPENIDNFIKANNYVSIKEMDKYLIND